jgi:dihydrofolate synthase/folylpolyglutamate synthase
VLDLPSPILKKEQVDISIIEVGMGGRLDATNIITPLVSVITNIGLDHTQFLGNTIGLIAQEKAGIIKPNVPVVIGEYTDETKDVFG